MLELVNVKERYVRDSDPYDPEEQVTIQVLDAASEAYTLRRDAYHACIA